MKQKFTLSWDWTPEQKEFSEHLFDGKLIKLYYSKNVNIIDDYFGDIMEVDNAIRPTLNFIYNSGKGDYQQPLLLAFPERFMCLETIGGLVSKIVESKAKEVIILTTVPYLMLEFTTNLVTIIDDYEFTPPAGFDTLACNMHSVYYDTHNGKNMFKNNNQKISKIIERINSKQVITDFEKKLVNYIGEPIIKNKLNEMIRDNMPKKSAREAEIEYLENRIAELEAMKLRKNKV